MIFILNFKDPSKVVVYKSLVDLNDLNNIDNIPLDFFEGKSIIIDQTGDIYKWSLSEEEQKHIIGFSIKDSIEKIENNIELAQKCIDVYNSQNRPIEFYIE